MRGQSCYVENCVTQRMAIEIWTCSGN